MTAEQTKRNAEIMDELTRALDGAIEGDVVVTGQDVIAFTETEWYQDRYTMIVRE